MFQIFKRSIFSYIYFIIWNVKFINQNKLCKQRKEFSYAGWEDRDYEVHALCLLSLNNPISKQRQN